MNIDKRLNLVIPHEQADGVTIYIHSTPVTVETFRQHFEVLAYLWTEITALGAASAPRVAAMLLRKIATDRGTLAGKLGVEATLIGEIKRLTMVIIPGKPSLMLEDAIRSGILSEEDADTVENMLVFFTAVSCMVVGARRTVWLTTMASMWDAQISPLNSTDFARSLPTLTETANTGGTPTTSSPPS